MGAQPSSLSTPVLVPSSSSTPVSVPSSSSSFSYIPILLPSSWGLRMFSLDEIKKATKNFDHSLLLRRGWMSEVYKGTFDDYGTEPRTFTIKVFKLQSFRSSSKQVFEKWKSWFVRELQVWSQFRHENVVLVIGYCHEFSEYIVVYEHMGNGNLAQHLRKKITPTSFYLSWEQCLGICIDAARGLEYIHDNIRYSNGGQFRLGDVAATNVFLDDKGVAKISDLFYEPIAGVLNEEFASSFDPQIQSTTGQYHLSSDIYAFGVLLVKILSRKVSFDKEDKNLGIWFNNCILNGTIKGKIIHPEMKAEISPNTLTALVDIAGECLNSEWEQRPDITLLVKKLELLIVSSPRRPCYKYSLQEIEDATNNFKIVLGSGGEGIVYKGVTKTNTIIAVKCLKPEKISDFEKEIKMLPNLDHPNLVSLIGYCDESDKKFLIYEFMSEGNLDESLKNTANPLLWTQCLNIFLGAAKGLRYLHNRTNISRKGIIHRDVKPLNILLDENFNAKISDFGLSQMGPQYQPSSEIATKLKGTPGHYAPEYVYSGKITRKIDVYAFGLVLFEVLCKKKLRDCDESLDISENEKFGQWAKENSDHLMKGLISPICFEAFVDILVKCLNYDPKIRPTMSDVVSVLEYALKWQKVWDRQNSGGDFCLPGGEGKIVLYCTINSLISNRAQMHLHRFPKFIEERDLGNDQCIKEIKHALGNGVDINMPQLFVNGKYVGDLNEIDKLSETGKLGELLGVPPYRFMCDTCRDAQACDNCQQTYWYLH